MKQRAKLVELNRWRYTPARGEIGLLAAIGVIVVYTYCMLAGKDVNGTLLVGSLTGLAILSACHLLAATLLRWTRFRIQ